MRLGTLTAFVGIVLAGLALAPRGRVADEILGPLFLAGGGIAVVGLVISGICYSRRSGAHLLARGVWTRKAAEARSVEGDDDRGAGTSFRPSRPRAAPRRRADDSRSAPSRRARPTDD